MFVERFSKKFYFSLPVFKKCHYDSEGVQDYPPGKEGTEPMEKSQELIGILQAISIGRKASPPSWCRSRRKWKPVKPQKATHDRKMKKGWRH